MNWEEVLRLMTRAVEALEKMAEYLDTRRTMEIAQIAAEIMSEEEEGEKPTWH